MLELYEEGERFWLVDERWGMAELDLAAGVWRSWLLPEPRVDPARCAEMAVLWPMAQLLRAKGVHLLPAASAVKDGWAALLLCPFNLEPELTVLLNHGYRLIGQRWTAVRAEEDRLALLHVPGWVERPAGPRLRIAGSHSFEAGGDPSAPGGSANPGSADHSFAEHGYTDLMAEHRGGGQSHAFCDAVVVVEPGRRARPNVRDVPAPAASPLLRRSWPVVELGGGGRSELASKLAGECRCAEAQLSRDPRDLPALLDSLPLAPAAISTGASAQVAA